MIIDYCLTLTKHHRVTASLPTAAEPGISHLKVTRVSR